MIWCLPYKYSLGFGNIKICMAQHWTLKDHQTPCGKNGFYVEVKYPSKRRQRNQPFLFGCFEKCLLGSNIFFKEFIFQSLVEHHLEKKGNIMVWCLGTLMGLLWSEILLCYLLLAMGASKGLPFPCQWSVAIACTGMQTVPTPQGFLFFLFKKLNEIMHIKYSAHHLNHGKQASNVCYRIKRFMYYYYFLINSQEWSLYRLPPTTWWQQKYYQGHYWRDRHFFPPNDETGMW